MEDEHRPIPEGCSLSTPLGDGLSELAALEAETWAEEVGRRVVALGEAYASFFRPLPKKGPAFDHLIVGGDARYLTLLLRAVTRGPEEAAAERLEAIWRAFGLDPRLRFYLDVWRKRRPYGLLFEATLDLVQHEATIEAAKPASRSLGEADGALLAKADELLASLPKRRAALALLRDVYARPEDLSLRLVLADALMDLGDPWGELIAIQCTPNPDAGARAREAELLRAHGRTWLGRLAPYVATRPPPTFVAGFPSTVATITAPRATGVAAWGTVTKIETEDAPLLFTASVLTRAPALRASGFTVGLKGRASPPRLPANASLEHLSLWVTGTTEERVRCFEAWARTAPFPKLKSLDLRGWYYADLEAGLALLDGPFGRNVAELAVSTALQNVLPYFVARIRADLTIPALRMRTDRSTLRYDRTARGLTLRLDSWVDMNRVGTLLAEAGLATVRIEATEIAWPGVSAPTWRAHLRDIALEVVRV